VVAPPRRCRHHPRRVARQGATPWRSRAAGLTRRSRCCLSSKPRYVESVGEAVACTCAGTDNRGVGGQVGWVLVCLQGSSAVSTMWHQYCQPQLCGCGPFKRPDCHSQALDPPPSVPACCCCLLLLLLACRTSPLV
jgi:hypothetical protein